MPFTEEIRNGDVFFAFLEGAPDHFHFSHGTVNKDWVAKRIDELEAIDEEQRTNADVDNLGVFRGVKFTLVVDDHEFHKPCYAVHSSTVKEPALRCLTHPEMLALVNPEGNGQGPSSLSTGPIRQNVGGGPILPSALFTNVSLFKKALRSANPTLTDDHVGRLWANFNSSNAFHQECIGFITHHLNRAMMLQHKRSAALSMGALLPVTAHSCSRSHILLGSAAHTHGIVPHGHHVNTSSLSTLCLLSICPSRTDSVIQTLQPRRTVHRLFPRGFRFVHLPRASPSTLAPIMAITMMPSPSTPRCSTSCGCPRACLAVYSSTSRLAPTS